MNLRPYVEQAVAMRRLHGAVLPADAVERVIRAGEDFSRAKVAQPARRPGEPIATSFQAMEQELMRLETMA